MPKEIETVRILRGREVTLSFYGTVGANLKTTLVSKRINFPFTSGQFRVHFALNTNKTLRLAFFVSPDKEASTTVEPNGQNILDVLGQVGYLVGDDETVTIPYRVRVPEVGVYLKVWAVNTDSYEHSIDAQVTLECEPEEGF